MKTAAHYFYHGTLSVYICAVISSTACHRQYVSCVGMQTDVTKKVITAVNSKCSFIQGTQSVVVQAWEAFQKRRITLPCWARYVPNRNPLTGSSEVLFSLPILLSGVGRGPLHIRPRPMWRKQTLSRNYKHYFLIRHPVKHWALSDQGVKYVCKYVSCVEIKRLWWKQNKVQRCCPVEKLKNINIVMAFRQHLYNNLYNNYYVKAWMNQTTC